MAGVTVTWLTINGAGEERTAPGLYTVIVGVPGDKISPARMAADSSVELTKTVVLELPLILTSDWVLKLVPITVILKAGSPAQAIFGEMLVNVGTGLEILNGLLVALIEVGEVEFATRV